MHPIIFEWGSISLYSYAAVMILGFAIVLIWTGSRLKKNGLNPHICPGLGLWVIPGSLIGAKVFFLLYLVLFYGWIPNSFSNFITGIKQSGFIAFGGVIFGSITGILFCRLKKIPFLKYADVFAPQLAIGVVIMRFGCIFAGCCFGKFDGGFWGLRFDPSSPAGGYQEAMHFHSLFPSQLFAVFNALVIYYSLRVIERKKLKEGTVFLSFLLLYSLSRFLVDFTRWYGPNEYVFVFTYNQWTAIATSVIVVSTLAFMHWRKNEIAISY